MKDIQEAHKLLEDTASLFSHLQTQEFRHLQLILMNRFAIGVPQVKNNSSMIQTISCFLLQGVTDRQLRKCYRLLLKHPGDEDLLVS